ncbi:death-associated protein kinase 1-like isoform X3 [Corticium candelabrum]|uniref:death-associated protein kinase 1-like isoform X3 n=1 Tax=Corticium candelabrum TaxID=121492 RepID=UPI002E26E3D2|nr:death-associated protein kinase 1-like isoform X3 [Corticium candelabrum]
MSERDITRLNDRLLSAVLMESRDEVEGLLDEGAEVDACDRYGWTVLIIACRNGSKSLVELLLSRGADINRTDKWGWTALMWTAFSGYDEIIDILLAAKANVKQKNEYGTTAFDFAMMNGHMSTAGRLVFASVRVEDLTVETRSPVFHWACKNKRVDVARNIVEHDGTEWKGKDGRDALDIVAVYDNVDIADIILKRRLPDGNDVETTVSMSMEDVAVETRCVVFHWAHKNSRVDVIRKIVEEGTEVKDYLGRTLLHYAADHGNCDVVDVLLSKKADADARDKDGNKPFDLAVRRGHMSTANRLFSIMQSVEDVALENVCKLLQWACRNEVDVATKIAEKFCQSVEKKSGRTLLHFAAELDHCEAVECLSEKKADADAKDKDGNKPFDLAVRRGHMSTANRLLSIMQSVEDVALENVCKLLQWACRNEVDVATKIAEKFCQSVEKKSGRTLLHFAAELDHREAIECLLEKKADADAKDKDGNKPFDLAVRRGHMSTANWLLSIMQSVEDVALENVCKLLQWACRNEVDVATKIAEKFCQSVEKKSGRTLLHFAAQLGHSEAVECLLEKKADADAKDKDGKRPYQLTDGKLRRRLMKAIDEQKYAVLYAEGTVKPEIMKLCFIGKEGAGKTTLMEALKRGLLKWIFTNENQADDPKCEEERTIGINVMTVDIPGVGRLSVWDFAGQGQFHKTHGLFFPSNSFFILLVSLVRGEESQPCSVKELQEELQYWLSFLRASLDAEFIPTVLIAGSHIDYCPGREGVLQRVVDDMRELFKGKINIIEVCFVLDCRRSRSPEMKQLKKVLCDVKQQLQQSAPLYPRLCKPVVSKLLPSLRKKEKDPFMKKATLMERIEQEACPGQEKKVVQKVVDFLDDSGEIAVAGDVAALNPASLHHYAIGPLIASEDFKYHVRSKTKDGTVTREEAESAIDRFQKDKKIQVQLDTDKVLAINESLDICFKVEGRDDTYMFPALLPPKDLSVMWKRDESKKVYVGRRQVCNSQTTIFSPSAFGMFQSKVCTTLDKKALLWRNGLITSQGHEAKFHVQCLIAMVDPVRSVDFVCRGGEATEVECISLLDTVMSLWRDMLETYSPGTDYETKYLSRKHLEEHKELKQVAVYSKKEIKEAKVTGKGAKAAVKQVVGDELVVESLGDLLLSELNAEEENCQFCQSGMLPDYETVRNTVVKHGSSQWYEIAVKLGLNNNKIREETHNKATDGGKLTAVIEAKREQVGKMETVKESLRACHRIHTPIDREVEYELEKKGKEC